VKLQLDSTDYAAIAVELAPLLVEQLVIAGSPTSPWMTTVEAIEYTRIPAGTFRQLAASGRIPCHGGRRKLFHRVEVDEAILGYRHRSELAELQRAS
jgi:excisionase family DNA binding protein